MLYVEPICQCSLFHERHDTKATFDKPFLTDQPRLSHGYLHPVISVTPGMQRFMHFGREGGHPESSLQNATFGPHSFLRFLHTIMIDGGNVRQ